MELLWCTYVYMSEHIACFTFMISSLPAAVYIFKHICMHVLDSGWTSNDSGKLPSPPLSLHLGLKLNS